MKDTVAGMKHIFNRFLLVWVLTMVLSLVLFMAFHKQGGDKVFVPVAIFSILGLPILYLPTALFIIPLLNRQWKTAGSRLVVLAVLIVIGIVVAVVATVAIPAVIMLILVYIVSIAGMAGSGPGRDPGTTARMYEAAKRDHLGRGGN